MEKNAMLHTLAHSTINGRGVWQYGIESELGWHYIVQWESKGLALDEELFRSEQKAEKKYNTICKQMVDGRI